jgi:hypothetical protein
VALAKDATAFNSVELDQVLRSANLKRKWARKRSINENGIPKRTPRYGLARARGGNVLGQGAREAPAQAELRPTAPGLANTPTRRPADPPTRFPVPRRYFPLPLSLSLADS